MVAIIKNFIIYLIHSFLNWKYSKLFSVLKDKGLIKNIGFKPSDCFELFYLYYNSIYNESGLLGINKYRKNYIQGLKGMKTLYMDPSKKLTISSFPFLPNFLVNFSNIRLTIENFNLVSPILSLLVNMAIVPVVILALLNILKRVIFWLSILLTSVVATLNYVNPAVKFNNINEYLSVHFLSVYNYIFNDNIPVLKSDRVSSVVIQSSTSTPDHLTQVKLDYIIKVLHSKAEVQIKSPEPILHNKTTNYYDNIMESITDSIYNLNDSIYTSINNLFGTDISNISLSILVGTLTIAAFSIYNYGYKYCCLLLIYYYIE